MNYLSLKYFLTVAEELNITKAAKKLYISQQSLSEHIAKLEDNYNIKLFERSPRLQLTYAGTRLKELAEKMVYLDEEINISLGELSSSKRVNLYIGMSPVHGRIILPYILPKFCKENPNVSLNLTLEKSDKIIQLLMEKKLDIIICFKPPIPDPDIQSVPLIEDKFCLIFTQELLDKYNLTIEDFYDDKKLKRALSIIPFFMSVNGSRISTAANIYFKNYDITPNIIIEAIDLEAQFSLCKSGMGAMFSFEIFARHRIQESKGQKFYYIPVDVENISAQLSIAFHRSRFKTKSGASFIDSTRKFFETEAKEILSGSTGISRN